MFTGIILTQGTVRTVEKVGQARRVTFVAPMVFSNLTKGESIAVNGACLTVEKGAADATSTWFTAFVSAETLACTRLDTLVPGDKVNMERALALGDRLGGHLVSGHVDGLAVIEAITPSHSSHKVRLRIPEHLSAEVLPKGSITLDGVSLTINACGMDFVEVNIIPETWQVTTLSLWQTGTPVHLETDILGKYVRRNLMCAGHVPSEESSKPTKLDKAFLLEHGFG